MRRQAVLTGRMAAQCLLCGLAMAPGLRVEAAGLSVAMPPEAGVADAAKALIEFDIPAQPLAAALSQYAYRARQPVLYPGDLAVGRMSSAVKGSHTAEAALRLMLEGTGLAVESLRTTAGDTFTLGEVPGRADPSTGSAAPDSPQRNAGGAALSGEPRGFHAAVQARILQALCAQPLTAPGEYAALLRFRLDTEGWLRDPELLDATGSRRRDTAILQALRPLRMDKPPPAFAMQAVTLAVLPQPGGRAPCGIPGRTR